MPIGKQYNSLALPDSDFRRLTAEGVSLFLVFCLSECEILNKT